MKVSRDQWASLFDDIRSGAVLRLGFTRVDFGALDIDAFLAVADCRGLRSLTVRRSAVPRGFVMDDLLRVSVASGLRELRFTNNNGDTTQPFSEVAVLDYFFRVDAAAEQHSLCLELDGSGITDMFVSEFLKVTTLAVGCCCSLYGPFRYW